MTAQLLPNPVRGGTVLKFNRPLDRPAELRLFDPVGDILWRGRAAASRVVVPIDGLAGGLYRLVWTAGTDRSSSPLLLIR